MGIAQKLESITIPKNVTTIKSDTFDFCFNLKSITLPAGLTSFQDDLSTCTAGYFYATDYKKDENGDPIYGEDGQPIYIYTPMVPSTITAIKPMQINCLQTLPTPI